MKVNSSYYGFFSKTDDLDNINPTDYYDESINGAGYLGKDFKRYYNGEVKMGDTPSLLYMMDGDPNDPTRESWGGSFEKIGRSPRVIFTGEPKAPVAFCTIVEFRLKGPKVDQPVDTAAFWMETPYKDTVQKWTGFYLGDGNYALRYAPKQAEILSYKFYFGYTPPSVAERNIGGRKLLAGKK